MRRLRSVPTTCTRLPRSVASPVVTPAQGTTRTTSPVLGSTAVIRWQRTVREPQQALREGQAARHLCRHRGSRAATLSRPVREPRRGLLRSSPSDGHGGALADDGVLQLQVYAGQARLAGAVLRDHRRVDRPPCAAPSPRRAGPSGPRSGGRSGRRRARRAASRSRSRRRRRDRRGTGRAPRLASGPVAERAGGRLGPAGPKHDPAAEQRRVARVSATRRELGQHARPLVVLLRPEQQDLRSGGLLGSRPRASTVSVLPVRPRL